MDACRRTVVVGEDRSYPVALRLSDEDMVRLWLLAGGLLVKERARSSGEATALAGGCGD
jgi:hypothetical protein